MFNRSNFTKGLIILSAGFLGILPLIFTFTNDELFEYPKLIVVYLAAILIGLGWLACQFIWPKPILRKLHWLNWAVLAFLFTQIISTFLSIQPYTSLLGYYSRFHGGLMSIVAYVSLFFVWSQILNKRQVKALLWVILVAGFLACLYALPEHFGLSPSCILTSGGTNWGVNCWIQDVQNRVFGTFGQPNWLAAYIVLILPVSISLLLSKLTQVQSLRLVKRNWSSYFLVTSVMVDYAVLLFTKSRSGFLALVVGMVFWLGLSFYSRWRHGLSQKTIMMTLSWVMGGWIVISLLFGTPYTPGISDWLSARNNLATNQKSPVATALTPAMDALPPAGGTDSGVIRQIVWRGAWQVFLRYPIFGSGVETFAYSYYQDRPMAHNLVSEWDFLYNKAHNELLNYLATTGLVGTSAYLLMLFASGITTIIFVLSKSTSAQTKQKITILSDNQIDKVSSQLITIGLTAGIVALTVSNFFGFSTVSVTVVMYAFFAFIIVLSSHYEEDSQVKMEQKISPFGTVVAVILGLVSLILMGKVVNYYRADLLYAEAKSLFSAQSYQASIDALIEATKLSGHEALYYDELSSQVSQVASALNTAGDSSGAAQLASSAADASDLALSLNNRHLNFYKTRARVFIVLSQLNPDYLKQAMNTIQQAMKVSPTDPKLTYTLARIYDLQKNSSAAANLAQDTIALKANYPEARAFLAQLREKEGDYAAAVTEYQYILTYISPGDVAIEQKLASVSAKLKSR